MYMCGSFACWQVMLFLISNCHLVNTASAGLGLGGPVTGFITNSVR